VRFALLLLIALLLGMPAQAGEVHVAVAQNFAATLQEISRAFSSATGHSVISSAASTGKLYAQIENGAPFEVFLSADSERPRLLEERGLAVKGSRFSYALGRLVLWSAQPDLVDPAGAVLAKTGWRHLAIANAELAPYGAAAREVLIQRGLWDAVRGRLVQGEDIAQTFQFVATGNAELGFVALAQLAGAERGGSRWLVPDSLHAPIEQQAVLLARAKDDAAARALLDFLRAPEARARISQAGYALP
jgi:molybdate transport system substrate-binding protein